MFHLIDSCAYVLDVTREIIASAGFESLAFNSPVTYLEYMNSSEFMPAIAMMTCYKMPQIDGFQLVRKVRESHPLQKAILISGSPTNKAPPEAEHLVCLHLSKPYEFEKVIPTLKTLNLCNNACARNDGNTFNKACKFGLNHGCPFYTIENSVH